MKRKQRRSTRGGRPPQPHGGPNRKFSHPSDDQARIKPCFDVVVECADESQQREVFEQMSERGHRCRLLFL